MLPLFSQLVTRSTRKSWQVTAAALLLSAGSALAVSPTPSYTFSHLAGSLTASGFVDGTGSAAHFSFPDAIAVDAQGNLYVGENANYQVRKITPQGVVTTLAGSPGQRGAVDGQGSVARFGPILGITIDATGNLYVADYDTGVRKVTSGGLVTTLAGVPGADSYENGAGNQAQFYNPEGIAIDTLGNVFVSDNGNRVIRKVAPDGTVSTLAGQVHTPGSTDGTGAAATFGSPGPMAIDSLGNLYVADSGSAIRKITSAGAVTTFAGSVSTAGYQDATGTAARFEEIDGLAVDSANNVYAADAGSSTIRKITPSGVVTTISGTNGKSAYIDGVASSAYYIGPAGMCFDASGNLYITDENANTIRKLSNGGVVSTVAGSPAWNTLASDGVGTQARFDEPLANTVDSAGNVYVIDKREIRKITPAAVVTTLAGDNTAAAASVDGAGSHGTFSSPTALSVDQSGNIFVADGSEVRKVTPSGSVTTFAGSSTTGWHDATGAAAKFAILQGIAISPTTGNIFVSDSAAKLIREITPAAVVTTFAGTLAQTGHVDGAGAQAQFADVRNLAFDPAGNLYVADGANAVIRKIAPDATVSTVTMNQTFSYLVNVAVDPSGTIFTSDRYTGLYAIESDGTVVSLINPLPEDIDGTGQSAYFDGIFSIATDASGGLYIADYYNAAIRRGVLSSNVKAITISSSPSSATVTASSNVTLAVGATSAVPLTYNWQALAPGQSLWVNLSDGGSFSGTSTSTLTITGATLSLTGVQFRCVITNDSAPNSFSSAALLTVTTSTSLLSDIATRSQVGTGDNVEIAGFIITGSQPQTVLIRANGPSLTKTGIPTGYLADPTMDLYKGGATAPFMSNDNWGDDPTQKALITQATAATHSLVWDDGSKDSAIVTTLAPGGYTAVINGKNGTTGIALVEVYTLNADMTSGTKLFDIATRSYSGPGAQVQIAGFIITGTSPKKVVIRATGPTLATEGLSASSVLANPKIDLYNGSSVILTNTGWDAATQEATFKTLGVDNWPVGSKDSAIITTLNPGGYTAIVSGADGGSGVALVEVFDADGN